MTEEALVLTKLTELREQIRQIYPECEARLQAFPAGGIILDIPVGSETWVLEYIPSVSVHGMGVSRMSTATFGWEGWEHPFDDFESARAFVLAILDGRAESA